MTVVRPLIESGMLIALFPERMRARYAHYLVYPQRSRAHAAFSAFREWVLEEAALFRATTDAADIRMPVAKAGVEAVQPLGGAKPRRTPAVAR
jgi:LysR family transcriptional regulator, glycine cleavage system transcriptional activator